MLSQVDFKPVYASGEDEPCEFFLDALVNSNQLDLGLGYFSSSGFRALAVGFAFFIKRGGKMRVVINNVLSEDDKAAIQSGIGADPTRIIEQKLVSDIVMLKETLSKKDKHFFKCLSWLVATNKLEIKATVPKKNSIGIVHQKFGLFKDNHDTVAFSGSLNFSATALLNNIEAISCDLSWENNRTGVQRIKYFEDLFQKTWTGFSDSVEIIQLDEIKTVVKEAFPVTDINELLEDELDLLNDESNDINLPKSYIKKVASLSSKLESSRLRIKSVSDLPKLRSYQEEAIESWKVNDYRGIFEMATGTGKTFTALSAIWELIREKHRLVVIISCPFIHLAEQWQDEALKFSLQSLLIGESKLLWENQAAREIQLFRKRKSDLVVFVTTNASFSSESFQKIITPCLDETLLIIDEVHYAGAANIRKLLPQNCRFRLGLSATPERHGDDEGTASLFTYFDSVVFSFPIEKAIGLFLTEYYYHAIPVELTDQEFDQYISLTEQIVRLAGRTDDVSVDRLEKLAIKRARVQNNSINKLSWLQENIKRLPVDYSLFYAGDQIFDDVKQLLGKELQIKLHEFTSRQSRKERKKLLADFSEQKIQSLVAMKCLDEGVDVPPTRVAYFLASSSNPREFVQRRGRVLRKHEGKDHALIYDLISVPPKKFIGQGRGGEQYHAVKSAFVKEYKRVQEFAQMAINKFDSMNEMFGMADQLDLLDITRE